MLDILIILLVGTLLTAIIPGLFLFFLSILTSVNGSPAQKKSRKPKVSIIVPTHNEEDIIRTRLKNILNISYPVEKLEFVLVNSGDDDTTDIVRDFLSEEELDLNVVEQSERLGVAAALNEGVAAASNDIIFRTDADSLLSDDSLDVAVKNLADPDIGAVTGQQVDVLGDSRVEEDYRGMVATLQQIESHVDSTFICHGPCFAFEREQYHPIPEDSIADDTEAGIRIREGGARVIMDPEMGFIESGTSEFSKRRQRKDRRAAGLIQSLIRHRHTLGECGRYGMIILPLNWMLLVCTPWLLAISIILLTAIGVSTFGIGSLLVPIFVMLFIWTGGKEILGPLQPLYAIVDSQASLISGSISLLLGESKATWNIDRTSREEFE